jgi:hypothetical protein
MRNERAASKSRLCIALILGSLTRSIGLPYSMVRKCRIYLPRMCECGWYLDELACELAKHHDEKRRIRYIKASNQRDDALHATTPAMTMTMMNGWLDGAPLDPVD